MNQVRSDIIEQLRKDVLLQRFSSPRKKSLSGISMGPLNDAFPCNQFPLGAIHEFVCLTKESGAAATGFISGILSGLMKNRGLSVWIGRSQYLYPPAFVHFGIQPRNIIFINLEKEKDILWTMEEALKCEGLTAVIADVRDLSFKQSRRLQLAVEQSHVTGFVLRNNFSSVSTTVCVSRWQINHAKSINDDNFPGIGFPCWDVELLKIKNGKPGSWKIGWQNKHFIYIQEVPEAIGILQKKAV
jgi:protein ImuA